MTYYLLDRVIRLVLRLPDSIATTERPFSAIKIFKNRLHKTDDFLASILLYIEREVAKELDSECIIYGFKDLKGRHTEL